MESKTSSAAPAPDQPSEVHHSLRNQIIWRPLLLTALVLGAIWFAVQPVVNNLVRQGVVNRLLAVQVSKASQLETALATRRAGLAEQAEEPNLTLRRALRDFTAARKSLLSELQGKGQPLTPELLEQINKGLASYYDKNLVQPLKEAGFTRVPETVVFMQLDDVDKLLQYVYVVLNPKPYGEKAAWGSSEEVAMLTALPEAFREALSRSTYAMVHTEMHPRLRRLAGRLEGDLLLCDADGNVVYSAAKRLDYARNIKPGTGSKDGVGGAFAAAMAVEPAFSAKDATRIKDVDYNIYHLGMPVGWLAQPISDDAGQHRMGVCLASFNSGLFDAIVGGDRDVSESGAGRTEDVYIVGDDKLLRSTSRFTAAVGESNRVSYYAEDGRTQVQSTTRKFKADTDAVTRLFAQASGSGSGEYRNASGRDVIGAWTQLRVPGLRYGVVSEIDRSEVLGRVSSTMGWLAAGMLGALALLWLALRHLGSKVSASLNTMVESVSVAGQGGKFTPVPDEGADELGALGRVVNRVMASRGKVQPGSLADTIQGDEEVQRLLEVIEKAQAGGTARVPALKRPGLHKLGQALNKFLEAKGVAGFEANAEARALTEDINQVEAALSKFSLGDKSTRIPDLKHAGLGRLARALNQVLENGATTAASVPLLGSSNSAAPFADDLRDIGEVMSRVQRDDSNARVPSLRTPEMNRFAVQFNELLSGLLGKVESAAAAEKAAAEKAATEKAAAAKVAAAQPDEGLKKELAQVRDVLERVGLGDRNARVPQLARPELGDLARTVNSLIEARVKAVADAEGETRSWREELSKLGSALGEAAQAGATANLPVFAKPETGAVAQKLVDAVKQQVAAAEKAKTAAAATDVARERDAARAAQEAADKARGESEKVREELKRAQAEAARVKTEADRVRDEAAALRQAADTARAGAEKVAGELAQLRDESKRLQDEARLAREERQRAVDEARHAKEQADAARAEQEKLSLARGELAAKLTESAAEKTQLSTQKAAIESDLERLAGLAEEVGGASLPEAASDFKHPALAAFLGRVNDLVGNHTKGRMDAVSELRSVQEEFRKASDVVARLASTGKIEGGLPAFSRPELGEAVAKLAGRLATHESQVAAAREAQNPENDKALEQARWMREDLERIRAVAARLSAGDLDVTVPQVLVGPVNEVGSALRSLAAAARSQQTPVPVPDESGKLRADLEAAQAAAAAAKAEADSLRKEKTELEVELERAMEVATRPNPPAEITPTPLTVMPAETNIPFETSDNVQHVLQSLNEIVRASEKAQQEPAQLPEALNQATDAVRDSMQRAKAAADSGYEAVQKAVAGIDRVRSAVLEDVRKFQQLAERTRVATSGGNAVGLISAQLSGLSQHAQQEAERAGEAGRGFGAIAGEIQRLVERTVAASREMETLLVSIQGEIRDNTAAIEARTAELEQESRAVAGAGAQLSLIREASTQGAERMTEVQQAARDAARRNTGVMKAMGIVFTVAR